MTELTDEEVKKIAQGIAHDNHVDLRDVQTSRTVDSTGASAIEVKLVVPLHATSTGLAGASSAITTSRLIKALADAGEERLPIIRYDEEPSATSRS
jgi:hypothetical protein